LEYVIGFGPLGRALTKEILASGREATVISRRGLRPEQGVHAIQGSIMDPNVQRVIDGGSTLYHCANAPYHRWPQELPTLWDSMADLAEQTGSRLVVGTNLYAFGRPNGILTESHEKSPCSRKGYVRHQIETRTIQVAERGGFPCALVRASDFFGPGGCESALGDRFFAAVLAKNIAGYLGSLDVRHSYTYLPDYARTMLAAAQFLETSQTKVTEWIVPNAPAVTARELTRILEQFIHQPLKPQTTTRFSLRLGGLFVPAAKELLEMWYEFDEPFIADGSLAEQTLAITPTPLEKALEETVRWYRSRGGKK